MARFIFITGGVLSSLGKGVAAASLGALLRARGFKVRIRKMDPYLNVDPGTMNPYQHGEVYVTEDGSETDLDLGHYERFTGIDAKSTDNITSGKVLLDVLTKERRGDYLGATIQVVPHVTDEIKKFMMAGLTDEDFVIYELGGTVGDIEGLPFYEAVRQLKNELGREQRMFIHLTWLPFVPSAGEFKTKPTQHSVREMHRLGLQPDMILCRCERLLTDDERYKIALFGDVAQNRVMTAKDVKNIYEIPSVYHEQGMDVEVCKHFGLMETHGKIDLTSWEKIVKGLHHPKGEVNIAVIGKYVALKDSYKSLMEALIHGGIANQVTVHINWMSAEEIEKGIMPDFSNIHGILVPGGFGVRGTEGKIKAIQFARENQIPLFGICFGMQMAVVEACRNLLGMQNANSSELAPLSEITSVIGLMTQWEKDGKKEERSEAGDLGGTMRLGSYPCILKKDSLAYQIYGKVQEVSERHRHRYEMDISYEERLGKVGMVISGKSPDGVLPEIIERSDHPWFIGVQFHPEFKSKPFDPHPLFKGFIEAAVKHAQMKKA